MPRAWACDRNDVVVLAMVSARGAYCWDRLKGRSVLVAQWLPNRFGLAINM
eukprot:COSAG02_NODE_35633_length_465_cov_1.412568_2_plen_50_part_01